MKLLDAMRILQQAPKDATHFRAALLCGFTPLHLGTYLGASLQLALPAGQRAQVETAPYGDLAGAIGSLASDAPPSAALVIEWADLDPRLGLRNPGGWGAPAYADILAHVRAKLDLLTAAIGKLPASTALAVSLPTLPLPPVAIVPEAQASVFELELRHAVTAFALELGHRPRTRLINPQALDARSPLAARRDARGELLADFPYAAPHAAALAAQLASLLLPSTPKKGLITDLDDTFWKGIVGEIGVNQVAWDIDNKALAHGLYQQFLAALAAQGVLLAVASKNEAATVEEAFTREDLILTRDKLFPVEAHWNPKSGSISRILREWNIGADAVVFIDDSPHEVAEVREAHPEVECFLFPKNDPQGLVDLLERLRALFGKETISAEDKLRLESLRAASQQREALGGGEISEQFLASAGARIEVSYSKDPADIRPLELINKTNQFNLNGRRVTEAEWQAYLADPARVIQVLSYQDKFGSLGKIGVLSGRLAGNALRVDHWVLSCRAFSRRVEHQALNLLFDQFSLERIEFDWAETPKNSPLRIFFSDLWNAPPVAAEPLAINRREFAERLPALHHEIKGGGAS
jgi:FkbH-like protein